MLCMCCIFFFKQKTAYEMRISDWSSDVCSSDLHPAREVAEALESEMEARAHRAGQPNLARPLGSHLPVSIRTLATSKTVMLGQRPERSEEHTSELQSLMRISYAVFCLKKNTQLHTHTRQISRTKTTT